MNHGITDDTATRDSGLGGCPVEVAIAVNFAPLAVMYCTEPELMPLLLPPIDTDVPCALVGICGAGLLAFGGGVGALLRVFFPFSPALFPEL